MQRVDQALPGRNFIGIEKGDAGNPHIIFQPVKKFFYRQGVLVFRLFFLSLFDKYASFPEFGKNELAIFQLSQMFFAIRVYQLDTPVFGNGPFAARRSLVG